MLLIHIINVMYGFANALSEPIAYKMARVEDGRLSEPEVNFSFKSWRVRDRQRDRSRTLRRRPQTL